MTTLSATRQLRPLLLAPVLAVLALLPAPAQPADEAPAATQPFPTLDAGMHTASIRRFAVDRAGRYGVSASHDKTARVWDLQDGSLLLQPEAASGSIRWSCRIPSSGGLSPRHVPAECRGS